MGNAKDSRINMYFHCKNCMEEITEEKRAELMSGKGKLHTDERLAVGWTKEGIQVVCENCGKTVVDIDFLGQKVDYYHGREDDTSNPTN